MKRKSIALIALAMLMALSLMNTAMAANEPMNTEAKVAFTEGDVEFGEVELDNGIYNMDIDFGTRTLPTGESTYLAISNNDNDDHSGSHTLRILNAKANVDSLTVNVALTAFTTTAPVPVQSFDGVIKMKDPTAAPSTTPSTPFEITSRDGTAQVLTGADMGNGTYDTTWSQENISLTLAELEAAKVKEPASYLATLTWTLVLG